MPKHWKCWAEYLRHIPVWCKRFKYRRCWRIHSPFAYRFVREVIFATTADKACLATAQHMARHTHHDYAWQRYHRLVYRLARYQANRQAQREDTTPLRWVVITAHGQSSLIPYLEAAAQATPTLDINIQCYTPETFVHMAISMPDLLYIDGSLMAEHMGLWSLLTTAAPHTLLIIRSIYHTPVETALWQRLEHHSHTILTFDLYYMGLVLFHQGLSKEAHKLCF